MNVKPIDLADIKTEVIRLPHEAAYRIQHGAAIDGETHYVWHYQEGIPDSQALNVLREDAKIKFQLTQREIN